VEALTMASVFRWGKRLLVPLVAVSLAVSAWTDYGSGAAVMVVGAVFWGAVAEALRR
jgi:hypothetical protein